MSEKMELLDAEERQWHELWSRFEKVSDWETPGVNGEWCAKDVLAHVAVWHAYTTDRLETLRMTGDLPPAAEVDAFNEEQYHNCKDDSLHDVKVMSGAARHRFREEVGEIAEPLSELLKKIIAANGHEHYLEHIPMLDAFLGQA